MQYVNKLINMIQNLIMCDFGFWDLAVSCIEAFSTFWHVLQLHASYL
jgi:hypothetical protein